MQLGVRARRAGVVGDDVDKTPPIVKETLWRSEPEFTFNRNEMYFDVFISFNRRCVLSFQLEHATMKINSVF